MTISKEKLAERARIAEKLTLMFEDVHLDGDTGEIIAKECTSPGKSFKGFLKRDPRGRTICGYIAKAGKRRPNSTNVRPR